MASGQAKHGKEKTEERGEWAGQVRSSISLLGAQEKSPCSEQLQLRLIPARSRTATPSTVASPSSPRCVCACCASLLPCFSHITAGFAPPPLPAVALFACSISPLTAAPTEWSPTGWQGRASPPLSCIAGQARTSTKRRWCDPQLRQTEPAAGPQHTTVGHSCTSTPEAHGTELAPCWELLGRDAGGAPAVGLLQISALCPAVTSDVLDLLDALPGHSVLACFNPPCFSTCCSAAPTNASSVVALSEASPTHATNQTGKSRPSRREMLGQR